MKRFLELKLYELLAFYIGLFVIYVLLPAPLYFLRHIIAPLMAVTIVVVFLSSLKFLKSTTNKLEFQPQKYPKARQPQKRRHQ